MNRPPLRRRWVGLASVDVEGGNGGGDVRAEGWRRGVYAQL